jgi:hypothetical protein
MLELGGGRMILHNDAITDDISTQLGTILPTNAISPTPDRSGITSAICKDRTSI